MEVGAALLRAGTGKDAFEDLEGGGGGAGGTTIKTATESRTNSTALTADGTLKATLDVGTWVVRVRARIKTANATMDFKYATAFTGTATVNWYKRAHMAAGAAAGTDNENIAGGEAQIASTAVTATSTGIGWVEIDMSLTVTVAGEFQFQWAQNTGDAGQLQVLRGSNIEVVSS